MYGYVVPMTSESKFYTADDVVVKGIRTVNDDVVFIIKPHGVPTTFWAYRIEIPV